jgi:hypothetical protein
MARPPAEARDVRSLHDELGDADLRDVDQGDRVALERPPLDHPPGRIEERPLELRLLPVRDERGHGLLPNEGDPRVRDQEGAADHHHAGHEPEDGAHAAESRVPER